jgi:hypothetical protein
MRNHLSNFSYLVCISCKIFIRWRFYLFLKTENSHRVAESRQVCVDLNAVRFLKSTMYKRRTWEMYGWTEANTRLYKMYKDLIWTELFCDVLTFPNSCCISSEMSKILFTKYFSPSRTNLSNYKFVTPLSFHQNNNYSHIYWIITFKIIDQSGYKTDQPKPGPFSLTIQPRKQKALGTRMKQYINVISNAPCQCLEIARRGDFENLIVNI